MEKRCVKCKAAFTCHTDDRCWCEELPRVPMPSDPSTGCLCPVCLAEKIRMAGVSSAAESSRRP